MFPFPSWWHFLFDVDKLYYRSQQIHTRANNCRRHVDKFSKEENNLYEGQSLVGMKQADQTEKINGHNMLSFCYIHGLGFLWVTLAAYF